MTPEAPRPTCCNRPMMKAGMAWSGRRRLQKFKCGICGRAIVPTKE